MLAFCVALIPEPGCMDAQHRRPLRRQEYGPDGCRTLFLGYRFGSIFETLFMSFSLAWSPYLFSILNEPGHRRSVRESWYYIVIGGMLILGSDVR